jgi:hypothetical protein
MLTDSDLALLLAALEGGLPRDALAATLRAAVYGGRVAMRVALEAAQASVEIDSTQIDAGPRPSLASLPGARHRHRAPPRPLATSSSATPWARSSGAAVRGGWSRPTIASLAARWR